MNDTSSATYSTNGRLIKETPSLEPDAYERDWLAECGFTAEEIVSLLWLRQWYQAGGSDRASIIRYLEFLRLLVRSGELEM